MRSRIDWYRSVPFVVFHLIAALGVFFVPFSWKMLAVCACSYLIRMFGITAGYHRYFAHRTYRTNRFFQFALAFLGGTSIQKGALWWAANHRHHHKTSDSNEDVHSPGRGFWWSHMLWFLVNDYDETDFSQIRDLAKYPELRWLNDHHWVPGTIYGAGFLILGGPVALFWGFVVSTVLLWHGTFAINSLAHIFGSRRYATNDQSKNNFVLALFTLGEGWHNNHHFYMNSARQGFFWWELDCTYYLLKLLEQIRIVSDIREPRLH